MKLIILAAGQGSRLAPLTDDRPKCLIEYQGVPILDYILDSAQQNNIDELVVVSGYKKEKLQTHLNGCACKFLHNPVYASSNMVKSLFCAESELKGDVIISYSDIVYDPRILDVLIRSEAPIGCVVDLSWKELWEQRMDDPLGDAESLVMDASRNIVEIGKKTDTYDKIEGQYMGLIKISGEVIRDVVSFYHTLDRSRLYDGKDFDNMYMTSFMQLIIDHLMPIKAVCVQGGWMEIDKPSDQTVDRLPYRDFLKCHKSGR